MIITWTKTIHSTVVYTIRGGYIDYCQFSKKDMVMGDLYRLSIIIQGFLLDVNYSRSILNDTNSI